MIRTITLMLLLTAGQATCAGKQHPSVGAIRWDAWTGGGVTEQVERTLGPLKYHNRLPWFAEVVDDATVKIDGSRQEIMDREIGFADAAGIDYWAFLIYPKESSMSTALGQYLGSRKREQINFCLILHNTLNVPQDQWPEERDRAIALLKEPGYQTVLNNRPLVYTFTGKEFPFGRFNEFLTEARKQSIDPYCVYMGWNPAADFQRVKDKGFDAVSAYAYSSEHSNFLGLSNAVEQNYWQSAARSKVPYIPLVTTGWDKRPRKDNPVSWEKEHGYHQQKVFPSRATPAEFAEHLRNAISFVRKHPDICKANAIVVYAWNEYDEGGWLAPTRSADGTPDTARLDAVREVLTTRNDTPSPAGGRTAPDE